MNEKYTSNNIENDDFSNKTEERDYNKLMTKLKEISAIITLFEKKYSDKF